MKDQHTSKLAEIRQSFDKEKQEETAAIIAKHEAQMAEFEAKIRQESDKTTQSEQSELGAMTTKLIE